MFRINDLINEQLKREFNLTPEAVNKKFNLQPVNKKDIVIGTITDEETKKLFMLYREYSAIVERQRGKALAERIMSDISKEDFVSMGINVEIEMTEEILTNITIEEILDNMFWLNARKQLNCLGKKYPTIGVRANWTLVAPHENRSSILDLLSTSPFSSSSKLVLSKLFN